MRQLLLLLTTLLFLATSSPNSTRLPHFRPGKDYALFFAIENYSNGWSKLQYPIDDAEAIAKDLQNLYGFQVDLQLNKSKTEIQDKLLEYGRKTYAPDAQLFVFFSGHGEFYEATKEGFIIPTSGKRPDAYQESYIAHDRLKKAVDAIPCNHILLAIDACYSGTIDDRIASKGGDNKPQWKLPAGPDLASAQNQQFINDNLKYRTRFYLTSGGKEQTPDRSLFAQKFLEALRSTSVQNPVLTFTGLQSFLEKVNPVPRAGEFGVTEPGLKNFLFIRHQDDTRDSDYDGIPDTRDECPTVYAKTPSGCLDSDEDGTPDHKDNCKYEPGPANNAGCPIQAADSDGDGIPDAGDACPTEKGLARFAGCPDIDEDDIPDKDDQCPQQKGPAFNRGCPLASSDLGSRLEGDVLVDLRDHRRYKTAIFKDGHRWMTENLEYEVHASYCCGLRVQDRATGKCGYRNYERIDLDQPCPKGWHIPNYKEWERLLVLYGGVQDANSGNIILNGKLHNFKENEIHKLIKHYAIPTDICLSLDDTRCDGKAYGDVQGRFWVRTSGNSILEEFPGLSFYCSGEDGYGYGCTVTLEVKASRPTTLYSSTCIRCMQDY